MQEMKGIVPGSTPEFEYQALRGDALVEDCVDSLAKELLPGAGAVRERHRRITSLRVKSFGDVVVVALAVFHSHRRHQYHVGEGGSMRRSHGEVGRGIP